MRDTSVVLVQEASQVAEARRLAVATAHKIGFNETEAGRAAIVATEAATNLLKHGGGGEVLLQPLADLQRPGIDIIALDKGPGIANLGESLRDGYSTSGSAGTGLGAISRLSTIFDVYSRPGAGTAVLARLLSGPAAAQLRTAGPSLEVGAVSVPKPGESVCGDSWAFLDRAGGALVVIADGLGHGPDAAIASREAVRVTRERAGLMPAALVAVIHSALLPTRGAAVAVAALDFGSQIVSFAGAGNVAGVIRSGDGTRHMVSLNGTVGREALKLQEFAYPWPKGALLIMHSDGLGSRWDLDQYSGLAERHPSLIAGLLYRDFQRGRDDVTVVVARERKRRGP